jgi:hypothetical protein
MAGEWDVGFVKMIAIVTLFYVALSTLLQCSVTVPAAKCMNEDEAAISGLAQAYRGTQCAFASGIKQEFAGAVYEVTSNPTKCYVIDGPFPGQESSAVTTFDWSKGTPVGSYHSHPYDSSSDFSGGDIDNYVLHQIDGYVVGTNIGLLKTSVLRGDREMKKFVPNGQVIDLDTANDILRCQSLFTQPSGWWDSVRHWWLSLECRSLETKWSYSVSGGKVSTLGNLPATPLVCQ